MKRNNLFTFLLALLALLFSFYLMFHTFSYDGQKQEIRIATKAWSDFGAHIPLIRSFSRGPNFDRLLRLQPIESPLFPGEPIRYHFGFYALVGILEKLGVRIDWALNIPSALGFFALLYFIFRVSHHLFRSRFVSALSVVFFLFNGSLSFIPFFKTHTFADIITNSRFASFGPWDGGPITAFWNLNIYTNQRHLALSYAFILLIMLTIPIRRGLKYVVLTACLLSALLFINYAAAATAMLFLGWFFVVNKLTRSTIVSSFLLVTPAALLLTRYANLASTITWQPGYLTQGNFVNFWWHNLGAHLILIPLGFVISPRHVRRTLGFPMLLLFLLPNLLRFSQDMINNHKFFNFFLILGNMFSAYAITIVLRGVARVGGPPAAGVPFVGGAGGKPATGPLLKIIQILAGSSLIGLLTISGIIDFFPILNDSKGGIPDLTVNPDAHFFATQTKPSDVVANSTWFYHPASIAGRSLFSGYTYFTWSYGYDQGGRERSLESVYRAPDQTELCQALQRSHIAYVELIPNPESYLQPNWSLWNDLLPVYENPDTGLRVFSTHDLCEK